MTGAFRWTEADERRVAALERDYPCEPYSYNHTTWLLERLRAALAELGRKDLANSPPSCRHGNLYDGRICPDCLDRNEFATPPTPAPAVGAVGVKLTPEQLADLRERMRSNVGQTRTGRVVPQPPPRYDEVYAEGVRQLEGDAPAPAEGPIRLPVDIKVVPATGDKFWELVDADGNKIGLGIYGGWAEMNQLRAALNATRTRGGE